MGARGEAFEYAHHRFAPPFFFGCAAGGGVFLFLHKASQGGEAFEYARRRFSPPFFFGCATKGAKPSSTPIIVFRPLFFFGCAAGGGVFLFLHKASQGGEAFEYARSRFAPPFFFGCATEGAKPSSTPAVVFRPPSSSGVLRKGRSLRVRPSSFFAPFFSSGVLREGAFSSSSIKRARGAKPSSTPAVVLRPPSSSGVLRKGRSLRVHPRSFFAPLPG